MSISEASYLRLEERFHLPQVSLQTLVNETGVYSRHEEYDESEPNQIKRIGFVIKVPQKFQIGNYCLMMSYDFGTGISTGLLVGSGVTKGGGDFHIWPKGKYPLAEIFDLVKAMPPVLLSQPMLLPTVVLQHHISRTETFCNFYLAKDFIEIQAHLGMSRAGRLHQAGPIEDPLGGKTVKETRVNLRNLTGRISTFSHEITHFCGVSEWQCDYAEFLAQTLDDVAKVSDLNYNPGRLGSYRTIKESIGYLRSVAQGRRRANNSMKVSADVDFGVLHSIVGQLDNRLNAKISASSSRDSTAMKILAFITTLFLPGTFVATVFSMSMFNWQPTDSEDSTRVVSSSFWIYWAITVPLTLIVTGFWRIWWTWEKRNFDRDIRIEVEDAQEPETGDNQREEPEKRSERNRFDRLGIFRRRRKLNLH